MCCEIVRLLLVGVDLPTPPLPSLPTPLCQLGYQRPFHPPYMSQDTQCDPPCIGAVAVALLGAAQEASGADEVSYTQRDTPSLPPLPPLPHPPSLSSPSSLLIFFLSLSPSQQAVALVAAVDGMVLAEGTTRGLLSKWWRLGRSCMRWRGRCSSS